MRMPMQARLAADKSQPNEERQNGLETFMDYSGTLAGLDHEKLDDLEAAMLDSGLPVVHLPVVHTFTPGLYSRRIHMPAGSVLTSKGHETEHQYVVLRGRARVSIPGSAAVVLEAGHVGITREGTRRALVIEEDCDWITFHPLTAEEEQLRAGGADDGELVEAVEARIIGSRPRADGRDVVAEYKNRLEAAGLPGPHEGARILPGGETP